MGHPECSFGVRSVVGSWSLSEMSTGLLKKYNIFSMLYFVDYQHFTPPHKLLHNYL